MQMIAATHRPAMIPFFMRLAGLPSKAALNPDLLGRIHLTYQAAMHATRAMVYFLPHLDSPELCQRKLQIYSADNGSAHGASPTIINSPACSVISARVCAWTTRNSAISSG